MKRYDLIETTASKTVTSDVGQGTRPLRDDELDAVNGGITGGCIRLPTLIPFGPRSPEPFRDVFAKYTLG